MVNRTLEQMAAGGIYDQVGGGFHRYSTDENWLVPHFEKMLYDNALLAVTYLEAYQLTHNKIFERINREILDYVTRELTSPTGVFFAASDADSLTPEGERNEGYFYTWTPEEVEAALEKPDAELFFKIYGIDEQGHHEGRSVPHLLKSLAESAKELNWDLARLEDTLTSCKEKLLRLRKKRPAPQCDQKLITSWNGLMISAFAKAGFVLADQNYLKIAETAADYVINNLTPRGRLSRGAVGEQVYSYAVLDDYAFFIAALIDLYEASGSGRWLKEAIRLDGILENEFEDQEHGGFFTTSKTHEPLPARPKPVHDGAEPSGNSVALLNLLRLGELTDERNYRARAERLLKAVSADLAERPYSSSEMLLAVDFYLAAVKQVVIVAEEKRFLSKAPYFLSFGVTFGPIGS